MDFLYAEGDMLVPVIIEETNSTRVPADTTRQFWVTVNVPDDAEPGLYTGAVTVRPERGESRSIDLQLDVLPITLLEPDHVYFGMYARFRPDLAFTDAAYRDMREHGMTTIGLCSRFGGRMDMHGDDFPVAVY